MKKTPKNHKTLRLSDQDAEFLKKFGNGLTEQLEQALTHLRTLEENQNHEQDQKALDRLTFLKEKERIKTEALKERLRERQKQRPTHAAQVDWGEGYSGDSDSKYRDDWGENY